MCVFSMMDPLVTRPGLKQTTSMDTDLDKEKEWMDDSANKQGMAETTAKTAPSRKMTEKTDKVALNTETERPNTSKQATLHMEKNKMDTMADRQKQNKQTSKSTVNINETKDKILDKTLNLNVELMGEDKITMMELLNAIKIVCGKVIGCRFKGQNKYEITMSNPKGKERLLDGLKIKQTKVMAREVGRNEMVVSFLNLPTYITDEEILTKLAIWGVQATSTIKRRKWAGTDIYDGTRFLRVKFNEHVSSLPYSTKFETLEGTEYFRVIHDNQVKVCRLCVQPGHILRDCPDFKCHKCGMNGHYARECTEININCDGCTYRKDKCVCRQQNEEYDDTDSMSVIEGEDEEEKEGDDEMDNGVTAAKANEEDRSSSLDSVPLQPSVAERVESAAEPPDSIFREPAPPAEERSLSRKERRKLTRENKRAQLQQTQLSRDLSRSQAPGQIQLPGQGAGSRAQCKDQDLKDSCEEETCSDGSSHSRDKGQYQRPVQGHKQNQNQGEEPVLRVSQRIQQSRQNQQSQQNQGQEPGHTERESRGRYLEERRDRSRSPVKESGADVTSGSQAVFPSLMQNDSDVQQQQATARGEFNLEKGLEQEVMVVSDTASEGTTTDVDLDFVAEQRRHFSRDKKLKGKGGERKKDSK